MNLKMKIIIGFFAIGIALNNGLFAFNQENGDTTKETGESEDWLVLPADTEIIITQDDEDEIIKLAEKFDKCVNPFYHSASSIIPYSAFRQCDAYNKLLKYKYKLIPYLIKQDQLEGESSIFVGSALADRHIGSLEDLHGYQKERSSMLRNRIKPLIEFPELPLSQIDHRAEWYPSKMKYREMISWWIEWWDNNEGRFIFKTDKPIIIDIKYKYYGPHISTEIKDGLLYIEAFSATYRQIIERAAAEMGVDVFIGEQENMDVLTGVIMRAVTFEEFVYLIGQKISGKRFKYYKNGDKYHFGGESKAKPRKIGWGIMMDKTVFREGDEIPLTIITIGAGDLVNPNDPAFFENGSFIITTNDGTTVKDFNISQQLKPIKNPIHRKRNRSKNELDLSKYIQLAPGEYNIRFKYLSKETPSIAIEVY